MEFKIVNVGYIEEVCNNSPELIREMIDIFREQVSEFRDEMEQLYTEERYYDLGLMAHKAKSSVAIMGMDDLAGRLKELELNAKEGIKSETYRAYISNFVHQTSDAMKELDTYLEKL
ncbi:MAG: Hpt domain-containing protein [Bacteroidales bacterium]|nr:Hpt domain-containing protein [Bacteroidales bacterium]